MFFATAEVQNLLRAGPAGQPSLLLHRQQLAPRDPSAVLR
jgi:hypothetical protein